MLFTDHYQKTVILKRNLKMKSIINNLEINSETKKKDVLVN